MVKQLTGKMDECTTYLIGRMRGNDLASMSSCDAMHKPEKDHGAFVNLWFTKPILTSIQIREKEEKEACRGWRYKGHALFHTTTCTHTSRFGGEFAEVQALIWQIWL
jgi:hypothetical protein